MWHCWVSTIPSEAKLSTIGIVELGPARLLKAPPAFPFSLSFSLASDDSTLSLVISWCLKIRTIIQKFSETRATMPGRVTVPTTILHHPLGWPGEAPVWATSVHGKGAVDKL